jgi:predicted nucleotidyltransferase/HEPN domain-containing protein
MAITYAADDPVLAEIVRRLVEALDPERIYLFGSRARGDAREDSDYDVMVILPEDVPAESKQNSIAREALRDIRAERNVLVWRDQEFNRRVHARASLPATILREGKLMYERDPARVREARDWLTRAARDLRAAHLSLSTDPPMLDMVVFHCQQAAEKAIKGYLAWNDVPFRRTHELKDLGDQVVAIDASLTADVGRAASLSDYAWKFCYPGGPPEPLRSEADAALATAQAAYDALLERLPAEARP